MTECAMYNITVGGMHPSTICVEMKKFSASLRGGLLDVLTSEYPEESMSEFIQNFARTDEVMPEDRTLGFVVANRDRKVVALSFSHLPDEVMREVESIAGRFRDSGFQVEIDVS